jgi:hypothetical protein
MRIIGRRLLMSLALVGAAGLACADTYPVSGTWTYENAQEKGPARECGKKVARFNGETRKDTATAVPEYKNVSVTRDGPGAWRVVDDYYNLQSRGRVNLTIRVVDEDHIELQYDRISMQADRGPGKIFLLRRCIS